jgi:hypothetical protein
MSCGTGITVDDARFKVSPPRGGRAFEAYNPCCLLCWRYESLRRPPSRSSGSSLRFKPATCRSSAANVDGESADVRRLARLSERMGAGDRGVARSGGESGGGIEA